MPPPLGYNYSSTVSDFPPSQGLIPPKTMAMAAPIPVSTRPSYSECKYLSARLSFTLDTDILPTAVTITLTSIRRTQDAVRHIVLHPDEPIIIGRSSRSEFKNLSTSNDNALFDCPVISRSHAKFELTVNKWDVKDMHKIYITDTRSMHGTSVNGQKLQPHKPFHLHEGDVIRLGDSVAQGQSEHPLAAMRLVVSHTNNVPDNYEGVILSLDRINVPSRKESTQFKKGQRGISYQSGSDSDSDDSVEEVEAPSSAQTTPDQTSENAAKKSGKFGSSILTGIVVDDENEPESVAAAPIINARSIMVPDTYDEDSYDATDDAPDDVERRSLFDDAVTNEQQEMDEEDYEIYGAEESDLHFSDDAQSQASDDDNISDDASSHHSFDSEPNSMSDFQDDEDEQEWSEQHDLKSVHDDQDDQDDDEEGPETMSSKRTQSVEIGTLGDAHGGHEYQPSDMPPHEPAAPTRPHYDPVRGMFQVAPAPFTENARTVRSYDLIPPPSYLGVNANAWDSSKWDVGPTDSSFDPIPPQFMTHYSHAGFGDGAMGRPTHGEQTYPSASWSSPRHQPAFIEAAGERDPDLDIPYVPAPSSSKKRKASEISTSFVPIDAAPELQPLVVMGEQSQPSSFDFLECIVHPESKETCIIPAAPEEPLTVESLAVESPAVEPPTKKLKTVQPRTKKSMLRDAAVEASKYTAGAIIGSIGLVTLLASPLGEALASC